MSLRATERKLTGTPLWGEPEVVLGFRKDGTPGVTVHFKWDTYGCFTDARHIEQLMVDLQIALEHLRGETVS